MRHYYIPKKLEVLCECPVCGCEFSLFDGVRVLCDVRGEVSKVVVCAKCGDNECISSCAVDKLYVMSRPTQEDLERYNRLNWGCDEKNV